MCDFKFTGELWLASCSWYFVVVVDIIAIVTKDSPEY